MREMKFKFWLSHTEKMTFPNELFEIGKIISEQTGDIIPLQYIGLKDRNNREVYEGDIYYDEIEEDTGDRRLFFVVTWINERCSFAFLSLDGEYQDYIEKGIEAIERNFDGFYYEITPDSPIKLHHKGDIYQNPELL